MNHLNRHQHPSQFLALTSLLPAEFDVLLVAFSPHWERYYRYHTLEGKRRQHPTHTERADAALAGTDTKLFFCWST